MPLLNRALARNAGKVFLLLVLFACIWHVWLGRFIYRPHSFKPTFDGPSSKLKQTQVVALLDDPIPTGKNAIWCASMQSAWKALEKDVAKEPVKLEGAPQTASALNDTWNPKPDVPEGCMYTAAGWVKDGILTKIGREFPGSEPPAFPGIAQDSFVAYSYLNANIKFPVPYFQSRKPLVFTDSTGQKTKINTFGLREEDCDVSYSRLRAQPKVYAVSENLYGRNVEFAVDLCANSSPNEIVVARISCPNSLSRGIGRVEKAIQNGRGSAPGSSTILLVPDIAWRISHQFSDLQGKRFLNRKLDVHSLDVAQQDIAFRLDRSGAEITSEAKMHSAACYDFCILDKPFLVYMKKRGAAHPYFAMWVDNAELLDRW